jgi:hypothetical protein
VTTSFADAITNGTITFGDGAGDFVEVDASATAQSSAASGLDSNPNATASAEAGAVINVTPDITKDTITFGNGNGDYVELTGLTVRAPVEAQTIYGGVSVESGAIGVYSDGDIGHSGNYNTSVESASVITELGEVSDNKISFGQGNGDYVSVVGDLSGNTITFGNGTGNYVSGGDSGNNKITMGNGNNDAVTLTAPVVGSNPGGDIIKTGTGQGDTVTVGTHTNADTFGFAIGTDGTSFTTITGAQAGDHIICDAAGGSITRNLRLRRFL